MKTKKIYYGFWGNGSSYNRDPYKFTNLKEAKKTMREIAYGNNTGSGAWWKVVSDLSGYQNENPIAEGRV